MRFKELCEKSNFLALSSNDDIVYGNRHIGNVLFLSFSGSSRSQAFPPFMDCHWTISVLNPHVFIFSSGLLLQLLILVRSFHRFSRGAEVGFLQVAAKGLALQGATRGIPQLLYPHGLLHVLLLLNCIKRISLFLCITTDYDKLAIRTARCASATLD